MKPSGSVLLDRLRQRFPIRAAGRAGHYVCDTCGHTAQAEAEVFCPNCGEGEMGWVPTVSAEQKTPTPRNVDPALFTDNSRIYQASTGTLGYGGDGGSPDWFEVVVGLQPVGRTHPPSLKNPQKVFEDTSQQGWRPGDSKAARKRAKEDLMRLIDLGRRQIGIPQGGQTAQLPVFPDISTWT